MDITLRSDYYTDLYDTSYHYAPYYDYSYGHDLTCNYVRNYSHDYACETRTHINIHRGSRRYHSYRRRRVSPDIHIEVTY